MKTINEEKNKNFEILGEADKSGGCLFDLLGDEK
jgi:hypothetical protein